MKPSSEAFEKLILKELHPHLDKVYAIKKNKAGEYVKYETRIAWEWYLTGVLHSEVLHGNRKQESTRGYIRAYGESGQVPCYGRLDSKVWWSRRVG